MLFPMMMMFGIIIVIIMVPAISFVTVSNCFSKMIISKIAGSVKIQGG